MGVHSLGEAKHDNAGYNGVFTPRHKEILNVTYYSNMLDTNFNWTNKVIKKISRPELGKLKIYQILMDQ